MKLLLIGPVVQDLSQARNFSGVWAYYVRRELDALGVEHRFVPPLHNAGLSEREVRTFYAKMDVSDIDHVVALGTRFFDRLPRAVGENLMGRVKGRVCQIHDGPTRKSPCHATLCVRVPKFVDSSNGNVWIGWAADPEILKPEQPADHLSILIDHAQLENGEPEDYTDLVWADVSRFIRDGLWKTRGWAGVVVRRIVDGGVEVLNGTQLGSPLGKRYARKTIPFPEMAAHYRRAHLFLVTHPESVGMSVVETSMAGALPIVPKGAVDKSLLATVRHLSYEGAIPWQIALEQISPTLSRQACLNNNQWGTVVYRILKYLQTGVRS